MLYTVTAYNQDGLEGVVHLSSGNEILTSSPMNQNSGFNPEELLATSWSTCLHATLRVVLQEKKLESHLSKVDVTTSLLQEKDKKGFYFQVEAVVSIKGLAILEAEPIIAQAHSRCPVSKLLQKSPTIRLKVVEWTD